MQTWNLAAGDPLTLTLAADARLTRTEFTDDQIWELNLGGGEPPALALQTTYGLRAHWMRLFPRFVRGESAKVDPAGFVTAPRILRFSPNTLMVGFAPMDGLDVEIEYWAAESRVVCGRIRMTNNSILPQNFRLEWIALLNPIGRQGGMAAVPSGPAHILTGETAYIVPVVALTGGAQPASGPYPGLSVEMELYPGNSRQLSWAAAAERSLEGSIETARAAMVRPWEAEMARVEIINEAQRVDIQTGNSDWDAVIALTQKAVGELLVNDPPGLPHPSFVLSRRPDQGFSVRGDGSDQSHLWNGQTGLDTYAMISQLLPGAPELAAGLLRNFLSTQDETGRIDSRPGLGGQRTRRLAQPLLACMAVQLGAYLPQPQWYQEVFPPLLRFFEAWFAPAIDQDGDGFPEWETTLQTGVEDSPIFDRWSPAAQGMDVSRLESPALAAMLYAECGALLEMARALTETDRAAAAYARLTAAVEGERPVADTTAGSEAAASNAAERLTARQEALRALITATWDDSAAAFRYRDYQTHLSLPGGPLLEITGPGRASNRKRFVQPNRLVLQITAKEERTYAVIVTLHGFGAEGEITEVIEPRGFSWQGAQGRATSQNTFLSLRRVTVEGLGEEDTLHVLCADTTQEDCSLLLPLWAGAVEEESARRMVEETVRQRYLQAFGIPVCPPDRYPQEALPGLHGAPASALLPWNLLVGEGLLRYGYRDLAADLVTRLIEAASASLKTHQAFRQYYHAAAGLAAGERGHLHGLAPVGLLLRVLGIRRLTTKEVILEGLSPFPTTIHVQYRKVQLTFQPEKTEVLFPGGQKVTVDRPGTHRVVLA